VLNFGLGKNELADSVVIIWPNDKLQKFTAVKAGQTLVAKLQDANQVWMPAPVSSQKLFVDAASLNFTHRENDFNDFTTQALLINYLSRQGPCMAKADINGDGREDVFIGGAKGQAGQMFLQLADGRFTAKPQLFIAKDSSSEDAAAEFLDADGDGDMDLYVGSGGYEFDENDPALQDRLYFNDGGGNFTKNEKALPAMLFSTACVKAADINGDGTPDLFVGCRLVPKKYPYSAESKILLNDGKGGFRDATTTINPAMKTLGMVTDALWMDLNKDGSSDLIVVGEWAPIKVFLNQKGTLTDASSQYINFASTGWWNRIMAEDLDGDGDKDLVIGNLGENAQFRASEKEPLTLHYKDFDNNGTGDLVFCYYIGGVSYPAASRDDLTDQLPALKKKFLEYHTYATATLNDLFTAQELKDAGVLKAELLSTVYLENTGSGFKRKALPAEAQYAPVYAMTTVDANGDGKKDLVLAGNNTWTRIKFGRYTANHGMLLLNDGKGAFAYTPQWKSGLNIRGNVRSLVAVSAGNKTGLVFGINDAAARTVSLP
jgi:enediyne biosynthesis protein E4